MSPRDYPDDLLVPGVPEGPLVVLFLSPAAARGIAATLGEHSTYPNVVHSLRRYAEYLESGGGTANGVWWVARAPLTPEWVEALR